MKQFLKNLIIFTLPVIFIGIGFEILLRHIPNEYSYKKEYLDKNSSQVRVLILGNSHMYYGINPEYIDLNSFNAGYVSQSLDYDWEILKKYDNEWDSLKYIIMSVDYFTFLSNLKTSPEAWRIKNYEIYYDINTSYRIQDHSEILSNNLKTNLNRLRRFYVKNDKNITCSKLGWGTSYHSEEKKNLVLTGKVAAKRHNKGNIENNQYFDENVKTLKSIVEFANEKNIKLIILTSPTYRTYVQYLDGHQLSITIETLNKIIELNPNITYCNLLEDREFTKDDFYDADHLNEIGAKKLSIKLNNLLLKNRGNEKEEGITHF